VFDFQPLFLESRIERTLPIYSKVVKNKPISEKAAYFDDEFKRFYEPGKRKV